MSDFTPPPDDDAAEGACPQCLNLIGPRSHWKDDGFPGYSCAMANEVNLRVQDAVAAERNRQDGLWGANPRYLDPHVWFAVLGGEFGEVAKALNEGDSANIMVELVQVAATAQAWVEDIEWVAKLRHDEANVKRVRERQSDEAVARYEAAHPEGLPDQPWER